MRRNTKATVTAFNEALISELKRGGIEPIGQLGWHPETPEFRFETSVGPYTFHPEPQIGDRPLNFIGVFGRFEYPDRARKKHNCNPHTGKWNFDGNGYVSSAEHARKLASYIAHQIINA